MYTLVWSAPPPQYFHQADVHSPSLGPHCFRLKVLAPVISRSTVYEGSPWLAWLVQPPCQQSPSEQKQLPVPEKTWRYRILLACSIRPPASVPAIVHAE